MGGSLELAGASADSLLEPSEGDSAVGSGGNTNSALAAMTSWCNSNNNGSGGGAPKAIICTYDGATEEKARVDRTKTPEQRETGLNNEVELICGGIRVAARAITNNSGGNGVSSSGVNKIALLAAGDEMITSSGTNTESDEKKQGGGLFASLFGGSGNEIEIPNSLNEAMGGVSAVLRFGELFGAPESSPESSPFMGGPRRDPTVREMYTQRSVRIDPTIAGGDMGSKTNRLALGEAASRLGLGKVDCSSSSNTMVDVSLSSFAGTEAPTDEEWNAEFNRVSKMISSGAGAMGGASSKPRLFTAEFSSVPSTKRLSEWIATKWAPAILRSYDIAGTRVGARPVYALQTSDTTVEIVWQELDSKTFTSVTSGKMLIELVMDEESGSSLLVASRGAGDASSGFGRVSMVPLPGEEILVRRLGDAASQAVEKGLAVKPQVAKKMEEPAKKKPVTTVVTTAAATTTVAETAAAASSGPGPRSAGARRSAERSRGSRKRKTATPPTTSEE